VLAGIPTTIGPYRIVRILGEGGMGTVYEAIHEAIQRRVALKVLHPNLARGMPLADALRIAREMAVALTAAHAKGIVHRDLKPDNLMLIPDQDLDHPGRERLKILDFGIAKLFADGVAVGTATRQGRLFALLFLDARRRNVPPQLPLAERVVLRSQAPGELHADLAGPQPEPRMPALSALGQAHDPGRRPIVPSSESRISPPSSADLSPLPR